MYTKRVGTEMITILMRSRKAGNTVDMHAYEPYSRSLPTRMLSQKEIETRHLLKEARQQTPPVDAFGEALAPTIRHFGTLLVRVGTRLEHLALG